ncbi:MAG: four helix bundle protein [Chlorobi bacterium]|nr:four helix bundle protein [Chlorobiota bacterium]
MGSIKTYRDLQAWQEAILLVEIVYRVTRHYPREEAFGITGQTQRAAVSVSLNIAEGYGRGSKAEFARFIRISRGSLAELQTLLILSQRLGYAERENLKPIWQQTMSVGRLINGLLRSLQRAE